MSEPLGVYDVFIIGAGPKGMACGIDAKHAGLKYLLVDKGCLVNSLYHYPPNMGFFTSRDLLEIGNIPFPSVHVKPTREEALEYYRSVTERFQLAIRFYERVVSVEGRDGAFRITTQKAEGEKHCYHSRKLVIATGYYDLPNLMGIPGEDSGKVSHYYTGPYEFYRQRVAVIGGGSIGLCAVAVAIHAGAEVALVARHDAQHEAGARLGAEQASGSYDVVVDAAGTKSSLERALELCRPAGTLLLLATYWSGLELPGFALCMKEVNVVPASMYSRQGAARDVDVAAGILASRPEIPDTLISHRFPLDAAPEAFRAAADRRSGAIKVVLEP